MTEKLVQALKQLRDVLQEEAHPHRVYVEVFINSEGYDITYKTRSPGSLRRDGVAMRNLRGEFVV